MRNPKIEDATLTVHDAMLIEGRKNVKAARLRKVDQALRVG